MNPKPERIDHEVILGLVQPGAKVLDLGCGDGALLKLLGRERNARGQGIEIDDTAVRLCVENGVNVFHGDIDSGLPDYPDQAFDVVILNRTLEQSRKVEFVLSEALRVGRHVIIGFPNFAHWTVRLHLLFIGRAPVTRTLPYSWFDSPNSHFLSVSDFTAYCAERKIRIVQRAFLGSRRVIHACPNWRARHAIFVLSR